MRYQVEWILAKIRMSHSTMSAFQMTSAPCLQTRKLKQKCLVLLASCITLPLPICTASFRSSAGSGRWQPAWNSALRTDLDLFALGIWNTPGYHIYHLLRNKRSLES